MRNTTIETLELLLNSGVPLTKKEIAVKIDRTEGTVAHSLASLSRANLIKVSKGTYVITPKGRAAHVHDPYLTEFESEKHTNDTDILLKLDWKYIEDNAVCRKALEIAGLQESGPPAEVYIPFVIMYLRTKNYRLPLFNKEVEWSKRDETIQKAINSFFNTIFEKPKEEEPRELKKITVTREMCPDGQDYIVKDGVQYYIGDRYDG